MMSLTLQFHFSTRSYVLLRDNRFYRPVQCYTTGDFRAVCPPFLGGIFALMQTPTLYQSTPYAPATWGKHTLAWGSRTYVMGILNITPDSFSRDGLALEGMPPDEIVRAAVAKARRMVEDGADLLDVGGESTRPGAASAPPLDEAIERARVVP